MSYPHDIKVCIEYDIALNNIVVHRDLDIKYSKPNIYGSIYREMYVRLTQSEVSKINCISQQYDYRTDSPSCQ